MFRRVLLFVSAAFIAFAGSAALGSLHTAAVVQPIPFSHAKHSRRVDCAVCHFICEKNRDEDGDIDCEDCEASEAPFCDEHAACPDHKLPDIPGIRTCLECHAEDLAELAGRPAEEDEPGDRAKRLLLRYVGFDEDDEPVVRGEIPWQRVTRISRSNVYFSHRMHAVLAKIECKVCHGDVETRDTPPARPAVRISMNWCLDCHREQAAERTGEHDGALGRPAGLQCMSCHR